MGSDAVAPSPERRIVAACRLVEALTALERRGENLVTALVGDNAFVEQRHYPEDEVFDPVSGAQFFLHAHRGHAESAHIHCFLRAEAFGGRHRPQLSFGEEPSGMTHVAAVALDFNGRPSGLFTTNLWVTEDDWYSADALIDCLDHLSWDHAPGVPEVNAVLTSLVAMYRPKVRNLLRRRDRKLDAINRAPYGRGALTNERVDVLSRMNVDLETTLAQLRTLVARDPILRDRPADPDVYTSPACGRGRGAKRRGRGAAHHEAM